MEEPLGTVYAVTLEYDEPLSPAETPGQRMLAAAGFAAAGKTRYGGETWEKPGKRATFNPDRMTIGPTDDGPVVLSADELEACAARCDELRRWFK